MVQACVGPAPWFTRLWAWRRGSGVCGPPGIMVQACVGPAPWFRRVWARCHACRARGGGGLTILLDGAPIGGGDLFAKKRSVVVKVRTARDRLPPGGRDAVKVGRSQSGPTHGVKDAGRTEGGRRGGLALTAGSLGGRDSSGIRGTEEARDGDGQRVASLSGGAGICECQKGVGSQRMACDRAVPKRVRDAERPGSLRS
eukprot:5863294-Prymnesium_polylepis.1